MEKIFESMDKYRWIPFGRNLVNGKLKCTDGGADIFLDLNPKNAIVYYDDANFMLLTEGTS